LRGLLHRPVYFQCDPRHAAGQACRRALCATERDNRCLLFGQAQRPAVCASLQASPPMCGQSRTQALHWLAVLETQTRPD